MLMFCSLEGMYSLVVPPGSEKVGNKRDNVEGVEQNRNVMDIGRITSSIWNVSTATS